MTNSGFEKALQTIVYYCQQCNKTVKQYVIVKEFKEPNNWRPIEGEGLRPVVPPLDECCACVYPKYKTQKGVVKRVGSVHRLLYRQALHLQNIERMAHQKPPKNNVPDGIPHRGQVLRLSSDH